MRTLPLLVLTLGVACATADTPTGPAVIPATAAEATPIQWRAWAPDAFVEAARTDTMLLIDVGMEGCTACRWMDELTYTNAEVIGRVSEHFIPVSVDSEARPDIGERYEAWGWPATIVMAPDGEQVLAIRGNKIPKNFIPILDQLIAAKKAGTLTGDGKTPIVTPDAPETSELDAIRTRVVARLDRAWHDPTAGWSATMKSPKGAQVHYALARAHTRGETQWRDRALRSLSGWRELIDPVWGGVFVASIGGGWDSPIPEKRTRYQAAALLNFANAYRLTGDNAWLTAAGDIDRYLAAFMTAEDGTFFTSQEDDAPDLPSNLNARDYYLTLDDAQRRRYGVPPVDHAVYTDRNALVIRGYAELASATGDPRWLSKATTAAEAMLARQDDRGVFAQYADSAAVRSDDRMRALPSGDRVYLRPQGVMGLALLAVGQATGQQRWYDAANALAHGLLEALQDPRVGGFFATDDASLDAIAPRRKPLEENAIVAQFLLRTAVLTKDDTLRDAAERAIRAVTSPKFVKSEGVFVANTAMALEMLTTDVVEMSVVGAERDADGATALFAAAGAVYEPRKVLHHEAPGRYPDRGQAALFICNPTACSAPITDPDKVAANAARFAAR